MKPSVLILSAGILICAWACGPAVDPTSDVVQPNVVLVYLDDLGYGDVSSYGATEIRTPNIDRLAEGGVRFTRGYATSATCSPSRYALLTGSYPWRNREARASEDDVPSRS